VRPSVVVYILFFSMFLLDVVQIFSKFFQLFETSDWGTRNYTIVNTISLYIRGAISLNWAIASFVVFGIDYYKMNVLEIWMPSILFSLEYFLSFGDSFSLLHFASLRSSS